MKFKDVTVGQEVNVKLNVDDDDLVTGKVRYKGSMVSLEGSWVGVELNSKLGTSNGLYKGNQYFSCRDGYGIFVRACSLTLFNRPRRLFDAYRKLGPSCAQEDLFKSPRKQIVAKDLRHSCTITQTYLKKAKCSFASDRQEYTNPFSIFSYDAQ